MSDITERVVTFEQVRDAVAESLGIEPKDITPRSSFVALGADSMDLAQLMIDLEDSLGIEIPDDDVPKLVTVQNVLDYVNPRSH